MFSTVVGFYNSEIFIGVEGQVEPVNLPKDMSMVAVDQILCSRA